MEKPQSPCTKPSEPVSCLTGQKEVCIPRQGITPESRDNLEQEQFLVIKDIVGTTSLTALKGGMDHSITVD